MEGIDPSARLEWLEAVKDALWLLEGLVVFVSG